MSRYFLEIAYKGTQYAGFQSQQNASNTIQEEIEKALSILLRESIAVTGASRTDAGVHARQNFVHCDINLPLPENFLYKINALLPRDIVVKNLSPVANNNHARFDAISRSYEYVIYTKKDPFIKDFAYFYPYKTDIDILQEAAQTLFLYEDFTSFAKRNTQVKNFNCNILHAEWKQNNERLYFNITANRFLRGMVRGLAGTMLKAGRKKITIEEFKQIIKNRDCTEADFSVPPQGLYLCEIKYRNP